MNSSLQDEERQGITLLPVYSNKSWENLGLNLWEIWKIEAQAEK